MEEVLVETETARLAREMGFQIESEPVKPGLLSKTTDIQYDNVDKSLVIPTQTVLKKWLLDRHGIHIEIVWYKTGYYVYIRIIETSKMIQIKVFIAYEKALELGLREGLNLVNQKRMKEKLIGFKTAKLAHEKGFSNEIMFAININSEYFAMNGTYRNWNDTKYPNLLSAPSHAILCRWLRERHKIYVDTQTQIIRGKLIFKIIVLSGLSLSEVIELDDNFDDYDEAFEAGLAYGLNLIKIDK
jgi:hypothetical protein